MSGPKKGEVELDQETKICPHPFFRCEIAPNGEVTPCCPVYCGKYAFGTLQEENLEQIWRGERAEFFRKHILANDYSLCDLNYCMKPTPIKIETIKSRYYENSIISLPKYISLTHDFECNLACNICRKKIRKNYDEDLKRLDKIEKKFFPYLASCEYIKMSGAGDPFASEYNRGLIGRITAEYPSIKFIFLTNGLLFTPDMYEKLGLPNKIFEVGVSIHAATESTYRAITRSRDFSRLMENLEFLSGLKLKGEVPHLYFKFVVCNANYQEMLAFVDLAERLDANCDFSCYRNESNEPFAENFSEHAIYLERHRDYDKLLEILKHENLRKPIVRLDGALKKLQAKALGKNGKNAVA